MFGLLAVLGRPLARRIGAINTLVHRVAERFPGTHLCIPDLWEAYDPLMWSVDRLHPGERRYRLLAAAYDLLADDGVPVRRRPDRDPVNPPPSLRARTTWMATRGTRWLLDRSTDLMPYLTQMVVAEVWYGVRGVAHRLDDALSEEIATALHGLDDQPAVLV